MGRPFLFIALLLLCFTLVQSQVTLPPGGGNQKSVVTQYIGPLVHVTVTYNSPDVTGANGKSREGEIWGKLVPYGFNQQGFGLNNPSPWRAGANECTTIKFSHDVLINDAPIAAGKYALFIAPEENDSWTIVFSKNTAGWGSYFYEEKDDALRVKAAPEDCEFHEWLTYEFIDRQSNSATLAMAWENKRLPFTISVPDNNELIVANLSQELIGVAGFNWVNLNAAANFCLQNDVALEQGLTWAEQSISNPFFGNPNFTTLSTKGQLLVKMGKAKEGMTVMDEAIRHPATTVLQVHGYGRQLINVGQKEKALEVFKFNKERFGDVWPVRVGLMRGYAAMGDFDEAIKHAKIAHERAPDPQNKDNLASMIEKLNKKEAIK